MGFTQEFKSYIASGRNEDFLAGGICGVYAAVAGIVIGRSLMAGVDTERLITATGIIAGLLIVNFVVVRNRNAAIAHEAEAAALRATAALEAESAEKEEVEKKPIEVESTTSATAWAMEFLEETESGYPLVRFDEPGARLEELEVLEAIVTMVWELGWPVTAVNVRDAVDTCLLSVNDRLILDWYMDRLADQGVVGLEDIHVRALAPELWSMIREKLEEDELRGYLYSIASRFNA